MGKIDFEDVFWVASSDEVTIKSNCLLVRIPAEDLVEKAPEPGTAMKVPFSDTVKAFEVDDVSERARHDDYSITFSVDCEDYGRWFALDQKKN